MWKRRTASLGLLLVTGVVSIALLGGITWGEETMGSKAERPALGMIS